MVKETESVIIEKLGRFGNIFVTKFKNKKDGSVNYNLQKSWYNRKTGEYEQRSISIFDREVEDLKLALNAIHPLDDGSD